MADPTERVLQLLSMLQTYKFWSGAELAERLGVTDRTLRRDIDRLRSLGYPVDSSTGTTGGYRLASGSHMPPLLLDDDEAVAIAVGLRAAAGASVAGIEDTALRALAKLEQVLPDRLRRRVNAVHTNVVSMRWPDGFQSPTVDPEALAILAQACRDHEEVRFEYQRRDGEQMRRLVQPQQLVSTGRRWYLVAWDVRREDWRTFRVDRVAAPALAGARFGARELPGGDAAAFVARSIGDMPKAHEAVVVVQGDPDAVREALRWSDSTVEPIDGASCRVRTKAESQDWVVSTVAQLAVQFDVEVEGPAEITERVGALVARLAGSAR
jgi:predicted DNA-binding transcriptional regulator YafY